MNKRQKRKLWKEKQKKDTFIVSNGIRYARTKDTVLIKIRDEKNQYIGLDYHRSDNAFIINRVVPTSKSNGFIFMLDKNVFEQHGVDNTLRMLIDEGHKLDAFKGSLIPEIC